MRLTALAALASFALSCAPAVAHRYCMRVGPDGKAAGGFKDLNGDLPEYVVYAETTSHPDGQRWGSVVGDGAPGYPLCTLDDCERFMAGMRLPYPTETPRASVRAYCRLR